MLSGELYLHKIIHTGWVDASSLASGVYNIEVSAGDDHYNIKAIRK